MAVEMNPYAAPASAVEQLSAEFGDTPIFSFTRRAGRLRYFTRSMIAGVVGYVILVVAAIIVAGVAAGSAGAGASEEEITALVVPALALPMILISLALLVVTWMFGMQRLHDLGLSGWWHLLILAPLVNFVFWLYLLFAPGTRGENRYGPPPPPNSLAIKVTAGILVFLWVVSVVVMAVIGVQAYGAYALLAEQAAQQQ